MKVLFVTSEAIPFIKTGGLADVTGTLVDEFNRIGIEAELILPFYRNIRQRAQEFDIHPLGTEINVLLGEEVETARLWKGQTPGGTPAYFIENDTFYDRDEIYGTSEGDFPDNASRFIFFNRVVCEFFNALHLSFDIIHCNDWQTGLIPVYINTLYKNEFPGTATIMTIHNLGYQGHFWSLDMPLTGLGWEFFSSEGLEYHGKMNFLKGGILFADIITTVSSNYAREILTGEYGFGLEGVLKKRIENLYGVINGLNYIEWNPEEDRLIPATFGVTGLEGKEKCKRALQEEHGLLTDNSMLIGLVTRLSSQKGLDLVADALGDIIASGITVVILGKGDEAFQDALLTLQKKFKKRLSVTIGFDNALAHRVYAGSDAFLMPSRYEPCGLGQLIALRYGAVPIVRATGGLVDTVTEYNPSEGTGTGFLFSHYSSGELFRTIKRAQEYFSSDSHWQKIQRNAMSQNFNWSNSAKQYMSLYEQALKKKRTDKT
jgi:starch synthase